MNKIQTIILDLGGVIINLKTEKDWIEEDLIPNFQPEKLQGLKESNFFREYETGKISTIDFIRKLKSIAIDQSIKEEKILQHWNAILKDIPVHRIKLLKGLNEKYKLILLSNTNEIHLNAIFDYMQLEFRENILAAIFQKCYYSQEIGLRKPNKEIYEFVLQNENLKTQNCLFFDDKPENLESAASLGIQTVLVDFNNFSKYTIHHLL